MKKFIYILVIIVFVLLMGCTGYNTYMVFRANKTLNSNKTINNKKDLSLTKQIDELNSKVSSLTTEVENLKTELDTVKTQQGANTKDISNMKKSADITDLKSSIDNLDTFDKDLLNCLFMVINLNGITRFNISSGNYNNVANKEFCKNLFQNHQKKLPVRNFNN